jgi:hypothetical protein
MSFHLQEFTLSDLKTSKCFNLEVKVHFLRTIRRCPDFSILIDLKISNIACGSRRNPLKRHIVSGLKVSTGISANDNVGTSVVGLAAIPEVTDGLLVCPAGPSIFEKGEQGNGAEILIHENGFVISTTVSVFVGFLDGTAVGCRVIGGFVVGGRVPSVVEAINGADVPTGGDVALGSDMSAFVGSFVGLAVGFESALGCPRRSNWWSIGSKWRQRGS